jgi:hypothetical protein
MMVQKKPIRKIINKRFRIDLLERLAVVAANWTPPCNPTLLMEMAVEEFLKKQQRKQKKDEQ